MCVSLLDISGKNPYSRIKTAPFRSVHNMRLWTAAKISKIPPYKMI